MTGAARANLAQAAEGGEANDEQRSKDQRRPTGSQREQLGQTGYADDAQQSPEHDRRRDDGQKDDRRVGDRGDGPAPKIAHYRPKRRSRSAYEASAASRSVTEKSGHKTCVAHISA